MKIQSIKNHVYLFHRKTDKIYSFCIRDNNKLLIIFYFYKVLNEFRLLHIYVYQWFLEFNMLNILIEKYYLNINNYTFFEKHILEIAKIIF